VGSIRTSVTADDLVTYSCNTAYSAPGAWAHWAMLGIGMTFWATPPIGIVVWAFSGSFSLTLLILGMVCALMLTASRDIWKRQVERRMRRLAERGGLGPLGVSVLTIDETGIVESGLEIQVRAAWSAVVDIAETPTHAYIRIRGERAFVIPRRGSEGEFEAFVAEARDALAHRPVGAPGSPVAALD
jgi:hypothetical protein